MPEAISTYYEIASSCYFSQRLLCFRLRAWHSAEVRGAADEV